MMSDSKPMIDLMQSALVWVDQMQLLLSNEYQALSVADSAALEKITVEKQKVMSNLQQVQLDWEKILVQKGFVGGGEGMKTWLGQAVADTSNAAQTDEVNVSSLWQNLSEGLVTVRKLNGINGAIIAESDRRVRDLLGTIRGTTQTNLYGQDGKNRSFSGGKALARF